MAVHQGSSMLIAYERESSTSLHASRHAVVCATAKWRLCRTTRFAIGSMKQKNDQAAEQRNDPDQQHLKDLLCACDSAREDNAQRDQAVEYNQRDQTERQWVDFCRHLTSW